jgi:hypothetical protein
MISRGEYWERGEERKGAALSEWFNRICRGTLLPCFSEKIRLPDKKTKCPYAITPSPIILSQPCEGTIYKVIDNKVIASFGVEFSILRLR